MLPRSLMHADHQGFTQLKTEWGRIAGQGESAKSESAKVCVYLRFSLFSQCIREGVDYCFDGLRPNRV